jgi:transcriptional regulator with XRE-family HTH domain
MSKYHQPLQLPADRRARIEKAMAADEGCIAVGGLAARIGQLRVPAAAPVGDAAEAVQALPAAAGFVAIARLVQLARREARQTPEQFAKRTGLGVEELQTIETAAAPPEPRVLYVLSEALDVSYQKLLTLAGHRKQRDDHLEREALRFAASSAPMDKLSKVEAQALHDFLSLLHE